MNKFITFISAVIICLPMFAEEVKLEVKEPSGLGTGPKANRTEVVVPSASIEDGVVTIETELASWGVTVTVYNGDGAVVYTSVSATEGKTHVFAVGELAEGDYVLEVELGEDLYEGNFTL